ncbi:MAG: glycosyltransferase family 4 protein [Acidimicrobiales bacterium]|nr:glycosyltransferase family 4 protein [Acidimicrobiales bacterium]
MSPADRADLADADVVHLSFNPPFAAGSYNSLIQALLHHDGPLRQLAVSFWDGPVPPSAEADRTLLVGTAAQGPMASAALRLPERARRLAFEGMGSRERIRYAGEVAELLVAAPPPVVVIWDDYKLGPFLRRQGAVEPAFVLSQHGRSYHLPPERARALYRLDTLDAVITLTQASYRADRAELYAYEPLVLVRPNGVDLRRFQPADDAARAGARARWALPEDGPVVLFLARLAPSKGAHLLLHSWARVLDRAPGAVLWLVGGGDEGYLARLRHLADRLGIADHVRFQGPVDRDLVASCHAAADVYVLPSVQDEGHPLSLLEAMASGLACVASDSPVVAELHGDAIELVVDPNVEDAFVEPLGRLLGDSTRRLELAGRARAQVEAHHDLQDYLDEVTAFLGRLAASRGGR